MISAYWLGIIVGWVLGCATILFWLYRRRAYINKRSAEIDREMIIIQKQIDEQQKQIEESEAFKDWLNERLKD